MLHSRGHGLPCAQAHAARRRARGRRMRAARAEARAGSPAPRGTRCCWPRRCAAATARRLTRRQSRRGRTRGARGAAWRAGSAGGAGRCRDAAVAARCAARGLGPYTGPVQAALDISSDWRARPRLGLLRSPQRGTGDQLCDLGDLVPESAPKHSLYPCQTDALHSAPTQLPQCRGMAPRSVSGTLTPVQPTAAPTSQTATRIMHQRPPV